MVKAVVAELAAAVAYFDDAPVVPMPPHQWTGVRPRSALWVTDAFVLAIDHRVFLEAPEAPATRVVLRDADKQSIPYKATPETDAMTRFILRYDEAVSRVTFTVESTSVEWLTPHVGRVRSKQGYSLFDLRRIFLVRIFNKSFESRRTLFHGFWEEMMRAVRRNLQIDGEEIREYDYSGCHTRLAYHVVGRAHELAVDPDRDLYEVSGLRRDRWRDRIKRATMIALNAPNYQSAVGAISALLNKKDGSRYKDHRRCKVIAHRLLVRIKQRHPALAKLWHTGIGLSLQTVESHIVAACLEELLDRAVLGLSTHDAISVQARHHGMLVEVMERKFNELAPLLAAELGAPHRLREYRERNVRHSDGDLTLREVRKGGALIPSDPEGMYPTDFGSSGYLVAPSATLRDISPASSDLAKIIKQKQSITPAIIKLVYAVIRQNSTPFGPAIEETVLSLSTVCAGLGVTVPPRSTVSKVARSFKVPAVVTGAWAARICRITADTSDRLGLVAIRPAADPKERAAAERRIEALLQGEVPSIVAFPKGGLGTSSGNSRASWYRRAPIDRQIAAIQALSACGDDAGCAAVATSSRRCVAIAPAS